MIEMCVMRHRARGFIIQIGLRTQPPQKDWARLLEMSVREALRCEVLLRVEIERPDAIAKLGPTALAAELQAAAEGGARAAASAAQSQSCPQPPSPPPGFLALPPPPRRSPPPRRGAFLRRTSTRASLALSSSNRAQSF